MSKLAHIPTHTILEELRDRLYFSNCADFLPVPMMEDVADRLRAALPKPFGERLLLALVMLHYECDTGGADDEAAAMLYDLLDSQTNADYLYYCECDEVLHDHRMAFDADGNTYAQLAARNAANKLPFALTPRI